MFEPYLTSEALSTLTTLCSRHLCPSPGLLYLPKVKLCPHQTWAPPFSPTDHAVDQRLWDLTRGSRVHLRGWVRASVCPVVHPFFLKPLRSLLSLDCCASAAVNTAEQLPLQRSTLSSFGVTLGSGIAGS
jgi:hypothetical protein